MITFPNAKINLGLSIIEKRPDGYHNLETVFYPLPLEDALEVTVRPDKDGREKVRLYQTGMAIDGPAEDNLAVKAYRLLDGLYDLPLVDIHLHKRIPSGAGLGGGSADAAFMLKLLNELTCLNLSDTTLEEYAARLGADCAFFIRNRPTYAEGIGNVFSPIECSLKGYQYIVVKPDVFVSTREAFAQIRPHRPLRPVKELIRLPVREWKDLLTNDFEASVFPRFPVIGEIKEELYRLGAEYAAMSGSGSSVFGLFAPGSHFPETDFGAGTKVYRGKMI